MLWCHALSFDRKIWYIDKQIKEIKGRKTMIDIKEGLTFDDVLLVPG